MTTHRSDDIEVQIAIAQYGISDPVARRIIADGMRVRARTGHFPVRVQGGGFVGTSIVTDGGGRLTTGSRDFVGADSAEVEAQIAMAQRGVADPVGRRIIADGMRVRARTGHFPVTVQGVGFGAGVLDVIAGAGEFVEEVRDDVIQRAWLPLLVGAAAIGLLLWGLK